MPWCLYFSSYPWTSGSGVVNISVRAEINIYHWDIFYVSLLKVNFQTLDEHVIVNSVFFVDVTDCLPHYPCRFSPFYKGLLRHSSFHSIVKFYVVILSLTFTSDVVIIFTLNDCTSGSVISAPPSREINELQSIDVGKCKSGYDVRGPMRLSYLMYFLALLEKNLYILSLMKIQYLFYIH